MKVARSWKSWLQCSQIPWIAEFNKKLARPAFIGGISGLSRFISKGCRHAQGNDGRVTNSEPNCDCWRCGSQITASTYSASCDSPFAVCWIRARMLAFQSLSFSDRHRVSREDVPERGSGSRSLKASRSQMRFAGSES